MPPGQALSTRAGAANAPSTWRTSRPRSTPRWVSTGPRRFKTHQWGGPTCTSPVATPAASDRSRKFFDDDPGETGMLVRWHAGRSSEPLGNFHGWVAFGHGRGDYVRSGGGGRRDTVD